MRILLLEDDYNRVEQFRKRVDELNERNTHLPKTELVHVETAEHCILTLQGTGEFHLILLDHDLGGEVYVDINRPDTGSEVARWLNKNKKNANVITHTLNKEGSENILSLVPNSIYVPGLWQQELFHKTITI